jgi:drug/metabolite transporter (DMT)-like permease
MNWLFLTILGVFLFSSNNLLHRILMKDGKSDPYAQVVVFYGLGGMIALLFAILHNGFQYWIIFDRPFLFIPLTITATAGPVFLFKSFQLIDASENAILQSSQKLWTVLGAFLFLGEYFSVNKILGTLITLIGIAIALWRKKKFQLNIGVAFVIIATFFYAGADLLSFFLVRNIDPLSLIVYVCFLPVITLLLLKPKTMKKIQFYFKPKYAVYVSILATSDTLGTLSIYYAYKAGRNASQIAPILGTVILISVLLAIIFLKERTNIKNKIIGSVVTLIGVLLVL